MRGLCGWFADRPDADGEGKLRRMLAASFASAIEPGLGTSQQAGLAVFGQAARPTLIAADGCLLAVMGHPRLREESLRNADVQALLRALRESGRAVLPRLGGDFALAFWDGSRRRGLLAVDRIGVHQIVYGRSDDGLAFASTLDMLCGYPGIRRSLSPQGMFDYVFHHVCPGPQTIFDGLLRVPAGHCVEFGAGVRDEPTAYWSAHFQEVSGADLQSLEGEFTSLLAKAVEEASADSQCGAFLSGGTDSSTVSGLLSRTGGKPARTFSIGFDVHGYDEMEYARIAAKHFGCEHHEYYVTPKDVVDAVPTIAASYDQPFGNASAIPTYYCAKFAREHGITRLLAGDGGDELFGGNERYAKHHLLALYHKLPSPLRRYLIEPTLLSTPGIQHIPVLKKLRSYVKQAQPPMPQRYASSNLLDHLGVTNVFEPGFLASINTDHPNQLLVDAHAPYADSSQINQMLGIDLRFVLTDGDLPKVTHMCELAGVDVAFPLLDERIVAFSEKLPSNLKLRGTTLRWFFKHALRNFLPQEILTKQKHGFGLPVGTWLVEYKPLFDLAADSVSSLRQRGIVRPQFIDELLGPRLHEHRAYFGTMIWVLMMLGLWLDSRKL